MRQVFLGAGRSQTEWKVAFSKQSANKWTTFLQEALVKRYWWHCARQAACSHPCMCMCMTQVPHSWTGQHGKNLQRKRLFEQASTVVQQDARRGAGCHREWRQQVGRSIQTQLNPHQVLFPLVGRTWYTVSHLSSRAHSLCEEMSDRTLSSASQRNSFRGAGGVAR